MAIYHFSAQMVKRSEGRNSVAMSAYRSGEKLVDEATDLVKDYTMKTKVFMSEILAPDYAPEWVHDRQSLWNGVEASEKRKDAQLAREINLALPKELTHGQQHQLTSDFIDDQFIKRGMIADVAYHDLHGENPHCHVMLTTRQIDGDKFGKKDRSWNDRALLKQWRASWQDQANNALEKAGSGARIDHRSLREQGVDREPEIHVGPTGKGKNSVRRDRNEAIKSRNIERDNLIDILDKTQNKISVYEQHERLEKEWSRIRPTPQKKKEVFQKIIKIGRALHSAAEQKESLAAEIKGAVAPTTQPFDEDGLADMLEMEYEFDHDGMDSIHEQFKIRLERLKVDIQKQKLTLTRAFVAQQEKLNQEAIDPPGRPKNEIIQELLVVQRDLHNALEEKEELIADIEDVIAPMCKPFKERFFKEAFEQFDEKYLEDALADRKRNLANVKHDIGKLENENDQRDDHRRRM